MNKRNIIILSLLLTPIVFTLIAFTAAPYFIDKESLKSEITLSFKSFTGLDLEIQGDTVIESFPIPHVIISAIDVHNAPGATTPFLLKAKILDVYPNIFALFAGNVSIGRIKVNGLGLELERLTTGQMNWQALPRSEVAPVQKGYALNLSSIEFTDASVRYTDVAAGTVTEFKDIDLRLNKSMSGKNTLNMKMAYGGQPCSIRGSLLSLAEISTSGTTAGDLDAVCGNTHLAYEGDAGFKNGHYYLAGKTDFVTADAAPWINFWLGKADKVAASGDDFKPLQLEIKTQISTQGNTVSFTELSIGGSVIQGKVSASLTLPYHMDIKTAIDYVDLETIMASKLFDPKLSAAVTHAPSNPGDSFKADPNFFINAIDADADLSIEDIVYNNQHVKDTHFTLSMAKGDMSIPQLSTKLPGNSRLVFTGLGKEGYQGFALDGQLDAAGDDFAAMITILKQKGFSIPANDFKRFRIRSNLSLSTQEIRLSEIAARIENIAFVGGIITTFDPHTKIESALHINGINMDHFITLWGLEQWRTSFLQESLNEKDDALMALWLKHLGFDLAVNASLDQYIVNEKMRDKLDLSLKASKGKVSVDSFKTTYKNSPLTGSFSLDVTGAYPRLDVDITMDSLNLNDMLPASFMTPDAPSQERWPSKEIDFHWLEVLNGNYNIHVDHLKYNTLEAANVTGKGSLDSANLNIDSLTFEAFGAQAGIRSKIKGGKIPIITLAANIQDLDNNQLSPYIPFLKGFSGKYNLNLQLQTNGNNQIAWISNLNGTAGIGARNVLVHGFNLPAIVSSVAYVRTVADVLNVVKHAFPGGDTLFNTVQGQWTISAGKLNVSNTKLANDITTGILNGEADLINWLIQGKAIFELDSLQASPPPTIGIVLTGSLDDPEKTLDTQSLEQYVTNKTSEKMLHEYGTH